LSQAQLAEAVGVDPSQISRFETGKRRPHLDEAIKIAEKLNLPLSAIVRNDDSEPVRKERATITSLPLPEGQATISYPAILSPESRQAIKECLQLIEKLVVRE
jgi:transcriptional regulator with XRE-family HTH domain